MLTNSNEGAGSHDQPATDCAALGDGVCPPEQQEAVERHDANTTSQLKSACSLEVTIQQYGDSREFKMAGEKRAAPGSGLHCHMCGVTCHSMEMFVEHMGGSDHMAKWKEITHSVSIITHTITNRRRRWCDTCQSHFSDDVISHRRTKQHKERKRASRPFCAACRRHLKTPRKFVEHMKSDKHKREVRGRPSVCLSGRLRDARATSECAPILAGMREEGSGGGAHHRGCHWLL
ncbi:cdkn1a interacting zinc finger protein 1b isoform X2 [Hippocampus comes]|uniref:cdkn1a interacting zinc finger protein 1b isoform X2 n=1 Tax=Hippocampus comes TaxID=109280 RepID=UPI00094E7D6B|nr:PREDICTED: cip1-interacting zinc finger protein-like isoform X2 [Hippocampus comes]